MATCDGAGPTEFVRSCNLELRTSQIESRWVSLNVERGGNVQFMAQSSTLCELHNFERPE